MTWLMDSHIHLSDPQYDSDMEYIKKSMEKLQIKACCVSMDYENSIKTIQISKTNSLILPFIGIHPEKALEKQDSVVDLIDENHASIAGIGEIGLDRTYTENESEFLKQKKVFEELLSLAEKYNKPVSIHSRKTLDEIFDVMTSYSLDKALLHWFDGSKKQLQKAMDLNFYVSYGPVMIYAQDKQTLLSNTLEEKILVETDGPVRFSRCFALKSAQVSFIPSVVFCASKVLRKTYDEMCAIIEKNSNAYLGV
ncbi:DNAase [Nitrosopumilus sp. b1]|uniref:TatD family hydrolase n=1 Tax=Nitrosopumilus sp. b1 TaxID=2109907 RepID=UPI0015F44119|nr:TatD family hydrolase [Nitrosopumilus sp. b1]KAF6243858.1 DNAase [Nitrosopumilus sp. b1]